MEVTVGVRGRARAGGRLRPRFARAASPPRGWPTAVSRAAGRTRGAGGRRVADAPARTAARALWCRRPRHRPHRAVPVRRRQLRFELLPLLDRCAADRARSGRPRVVCSVRDILVESPKPERTHETLELVHRYYDLVLVHGDPCFVSFDATFPQAAEIADRIAYTGYVVNRPRDGSAVSPNAALAAVPAPGRSSAAARAAAGVPAAGDGAGAAWRALDGPPRRGESCRTAPGKRSSPRGRCGRRQAPRSGARGPPAHPPRRHPLAAAGRGEPVRERVPSARRPRAGRGRRRAVSPRLRGAPSPCPPLRVSGRLQHPDGGPGREAAGGGGALCGRAGDRADLAREPPRRPGPRRSGG